MTVYAYLGFEPVHQNNEIFVDRDPTARASGGMALWAEVGNVMSD